MSSVHKKQKTAVGGAASSSTPPTAASSHLFARPPSLSDAAIRAALRPGQFCVLIKPDSGAEDDEYTLFRFVSVSSHGASVQEYDPDVAGAAQQQPVVQCSWSDQICLPVRPVLASGATVFSLFYSENGSLTTVYYRATVLPAVKSKSKAKDRQMQFGDGTVQTVPHTVEWEGVQLPAIITVNSHSHSLTHSLSIPALPPASNRQLH